MYVYISNINSLKLCEFVVKINLLVTIYFPIGLPPKHTRNNKEVLLPFSFEITSMISKNIKKKIY